MNLIAIIDKFYPVGRDRDEFFTSIMALGSPLYPLDPNKREPQYSEDYVVAVHPSIRNTFINLFGKYCPQGAGIGHAYFSTAYEVII